MNYKFYENDEHEAVKYSFGDEVITIGQIENLSLVIAFDYLSVDCSDFSFNNIKITLEDYRKLFEFKKEISKIKIKDFFYDSDVKRKYNFHSIDLYQKKFLITIIKKLLNYKSEKLDLSKIPTIYQIGVYTDNKNMKAPRIVGFFGKNATFHILMFDYEHKIYSNKI